MSGESLSSGGEGGEGGREIFCGSIWKAFYMCCCDNSKYHMSSVGGKPVIRGVRVERGGGRDIFCGSIWTAFYMCCCDDSKYHMSSVGGKPVVRG